ncbi:MAG TPA: adenylate/guanylate cyclase domain-containing protein [Actinomycetota bacterium]|jgi:class 3 adenylate cyclase|nr:adenylate/guanylate cyclase domain-containing protein [Actinomycetota bacterium]
METDSRSGFSAGEPLEPVALDRLTLRFRNPDLEAAYNKDFYQHNLGNLRFAFLGGVALWVLFGFVIDGFLLVQADQTFDLVMRYGVFTPLLLVVFGLTFLHGFERMWEWVAGGVVIVTLLLWVYYNTQVLTMPVDYGYVGLILITAFTYTLLRLRFVLVVLTTVVAIATYVPYAVIAVHIFGVKTVLATLYLSTFGVLWGVAAYRLERFTRLLFVRERQLDRERERSDSLLLNVLPQAIVARLKAKPIEGRMAEALEEVSIVFADAVGSTEQAAKCSPDEFAAALDELFGRFDDLADRYGLEKVKTIGDAYMAVAGAPTPMDDHAEAAADMALDMLAQAGQVRWPSGDPIALRVGVATGPAVAGVIGQRKFAYDLWGDTVNLASRLEASGEPGRILVSETMAELLADRYEFGPAQVLDLKGKGPTPVRFLVARRADVQAATASS